MRTLKVTSGPAAGQSVDIEGEVVIGREGADLTIEDPELSRRHVALRPAERGVVVEDLGSLNGTFVNGERISGEVTLTADGSIRAGTTELAVELALSRLDAGRTERREIVLPARVVVRSSTGPAAS